MTTVHIVTPFSRYENLKKIYDSIEQGIARDSIIFWWLMVDEILIEHMSKILAFGELFSSPYLTIIPIHSALKSYAGHSHMNLALTKIGMMCNQDDWIYRLDDDNKLHPKLLSHLSKVDFDVVLFDQILRRKYLRFLTRTRKADPEFIRINYVDTAMFAFRYRALQGLKWREDIYQADGLFIEELKGKNHIKIINKKLSYYNWLR